MGEVVSSCQCKYCNKPLTTLHQMGQGYCGSDECLEASRKAFEKECLDYDGYYE